MKAKPFIKWVGGKRALMKEILPRLPKSYNNYYEPFIGGGALFFSLEPLNATISDINLDLIKTYNAVKNNPEELVKLLAEHKETHDPDYYYSIRKQFNLTDDIEIAARFIYLNKTCFNGLYRVNSKGEFNVPVGSYKNPDILDEENILLCSEALKNVNIIHQGYNDIQPSSGDFVYLDPPYHPINATSFTKYTKLDFSEADQIKLYEKCRQMHQNGVYFMLSNSDCGFIKDLYKEFNIEIVTAPRSVNCKGNGRERVNEVLIRNY